MEHALDELDRRFGGIEAYLTGPAGRPLVDIETLRLRLVSARSDRSAGRRSSTLG